MRKLVKNNVGRENCQKNFQNENSYTQQRIKEPHGDGSKSQKHNLTKKKERKKKDPQWHKTGRDLTSLEESISCDFLE